MKAISTAKVAAGVVLLLLGSVFALQGYGTLGGSAMSNNSFWLYAGSLIALVGLVIIALGVRSGKKPQAATPPTPK
jgi:hypothetical protein